MQTRRVAAAVAQVLALAALAGCKDRAAAPPPPPPKVTVAKPESRKVRTYRDFTGTVRAIETAEIRARVAGTLEAMHFKPSDDLVQAGDVLFEIEPETYQAAFDEATASLVSAKSRLAASASDLVRIEKAIQSDAVSEQELDRARAARDQSEADVMAAEARLDKATVDFEYTKVRTPITGQVSRRRVDLGNLVGYGEPTLLTTVTRIQPIYVYFDASETVVLQMLEARKTGELREDPTINVATAADDGFPHQGKIDYIDNTVNPATGTIELRGVMPNEDRSLFPGLFVRIRAYGPESEALVVDERALGADLGGKYVLVVADDDLVEQRYVTLGAVQDDGTVVVEEGLDGTERYITVGLLRARPGLPVDAELE
jgi:RND family efflux transporter MFP subunit